MANMGEGYILQYKKEDGSYIPIFPYTTTEQVEGLGRFQSMYGPIEINVNIGPPDPVAPGEPSLEYRQIVVEVPGLLPTDIVYINKILNMNDLEIARMEDATYNDIIEAQSQENALVFTVPNWVDYPEVNVSITWTRPVNIN